MTVECHTLGPQPTEKRIDSVRMCATLAQVD